MEPLHLIRRLCEALNERAVSYVHWKSNINIDQALKGVDDLDLLVDRRDACAFLEVLFQLGFRRVVDPPAGQMPGIHHYYGFDKQSSQFVHVHAHFQLVLGHDATKNYHLPSEKVMLASANCRGLLPIPAPECELVLYTIRMVLKFSFIRNPLVQYDRSGRHPELEHLEALSERTEVNRILKELLPCCEQELFNDCLAAVRPGASNLARWNVRRRLHTALAACARRPRLVDGYLKTVRYIAKPVRRTLGLARSRKRLANGGLVIAIVGGDGAGKTSVVRKLAEHYSRILDSKTLHLGKPRRSWLSRIVRLLHQVDAGLRRRLGPRPEAHSLAESPGPSLLLMLKQFCTARDRYRAYARARRFATAGGIAICDRWHIPGLKLMDAPKPFQPYGKSWRSWIAAFLRSKEARLHHMIMAPDSLIVLRLHPDVAVARKTDECEQHVRPRSQEVWEFDWDCRGAHVIDASQPLSEVTSEVIAATWKQL